MRRITQGEPEEERGKKTLLKPYEVSGKGYSFALLDKESKRAHLAQLTEFVSSARKLA